MAGKHRQFFEEVNLKVSPPVEAQQADGGTAQPTTKPSRGERNMTKTSTYFSHAVHEKLREIAFHERKTINDLVLEGLDLMLQQRSYPTTKELTAQTKAS